MKLARKIAHWVFPRESNNQKPKVFHVSGLLYLKVFLISLQVGIFFLSRGVSPSILGYAANISPTEVIRLINEKRVSAGLSSLSENSLLSQAALAKARDMLANNYWAHVSPDGTQPWYFFTNAGYSYRYAGENLARDFSNPSSAVEAWMSSPTHRDNLLSSNYKETGVGVVEGDLNGVDTTIIVQFFGTKYADQIISPVAQVGAAQERNLALSDVASTPPPAFAPTVAPFEAPLPIEGLPVGEKTSEFLISPFGTTKGISLVVVGSLLSILSVDAFVTSKRRIKRIGGKSFAHISFLGMVLAIILILKAGQIL